MLNQKIQTLLLMIAVVIPIATAASLLSNGTYQVTAQVQEVAGAEGAATKVVIDQPPEAGVQPSYQAAGTNPNTQSLVENVEVAQRDDGEIGPQSTNSGFEFVPVSALRSDGAVGAAVGYRISVIGGTFPGGYVRNNSANAVCMAAPVYLPQGATLTQFYMYLLDNDPNSNMGDTAPVILWRKNLFSPTFTAESVAAFTLPNVSDTIVRRWFINVPTSRRIVSNIYSYYITFCFNPNTGQQHLVYGFGVDYNP
jgi:hypothetical protein